MAPRFTVIQLAGGLNRGTYDSKTEVAACLAFAKPSADNVEIVSDVSPMARFTSYA